MSRRCLGLLALAALAGCDLVLGLDPIKSNVPGPSRWAAVTAGVQHTCAIRGDGTLWCWGANNLGQLGTGAAIDEVDALTQVGSATTWTAARSSGLHTCGLQADHSLWCWGRNYDGQLGNGMNGMNGPNGLPTPQQVAGQWLAVATGTNHTCAIKLDGSLWCWGFNGTGQLGNGSLVDASSPVAILPGTQWIDVAAGTNHTCALDAAGLLYCWGQGGYLGDGRTTSALGPEQIDSEPRTKLAAGIDVTCGLLTSGHLECWGTNTEGQLGNGTTGGQLSPTRVLVGGADVADWTDVVASTLHVCGRRADGSAWCWGDSSRGQLGLDGQLVNNTPVQLTGATSWQAIAVGGGHTCGIADGALWCIGADGSGQLGDGGTSHSTPTKVSGSFVAASAGGMSTCAIDASTGLSCGGDGAHGELGNGSRNSSRTLVTLAMSAWTTVSVGARAACGVTTTGGLDCWGDNTFRQLGNGTTMSSTSPNPVSGSMADVRAGAHTCAIDASMKLQCWGRDTNHEVGDSNTIDIGMPYTVQDPSTWLSVGVGTAHTCAIKSDNSLWCWGINDAGQLGTGGPAPVGPTKSANGPYDSVAVGGDNSCALNGNMASCWGHNASGELGVGDTSVRTTPTTITGTWRQLALGLRHTCGIYGDGSLWCWGSNARGQLGDGTRTDHTSPFQISTDRGWASVTAGDYHTCATKGDQTLYCWGSNDDGALLDGTGWRTALVPVMAP
jgi:alpha-tubulin suppressor-like RCC1 family protein